MRVNTFGKKIHAKIAVLSTILVIIIGVFAITQATSTWKRAQKQADFEVLGKLSEHVATLFSSFNNAKHYTSGYARSQGLTDAMGLKRTEVYLNQVKVVEAEFQAIESMLNRIEKGSGSKNFKQAIQELQTISADVSEAFAYIEGLRKLEDRKIRPDRSAFIRIEGQIIDFYSILIREADQAAQMRQMVCIQNALRMKRSFMFSRGASMGAYATIGLTTPIRKNEVSDNFYDFEEHAKNIADLADQESQEILSAMLSSPGIAHFKKLAEDMRSIVIPVGSESFATDRDRFEADTRRYYYEIEEDFSKALRQLAAHASQYATQQREAATTARNIVSGAMLLSILFAAFMSFFIGKSIIAPIKSVVAALKDKSMRGARAAASLAEGSKTLADASSKEAASLEEISSTVLSITELVEKNNKLIDSASAASSNATHEADSGIAAMSDMNEAVASIQNSSHEVAKIMETVEDIASQTNILALNAAVEAARAGQQGAGFAVVADEVRSLALRSSTAASEIAHKIRASLDDSERGVQINASVNNNLNSIVEASRNCRASVDEIKDAQESQNIAIAQINEALKSLNVVTQGIASSSEENAANAAEIRALSGSLASNVDSLEELVATEKDERAPSTNASQTDLSQEFSTASHSSPAETVNWN